LFRHTHGLDFSRELAASVLNVFEFLAAHFTAPSTTRQPPTTSVRSA